MKLSKEVLANALAIWATIIWVICAVLVWLLPDFTMQVTVWMMHGMALPAWNLNFNNFLLGGISWILIAWVCGWIFGWSWERASRKR